ncbi:hypothetical protein BCR34DRAFT_634977 [Clohesyomyces aquaticus]|uniref:Uncharacterized protein n=1 Tax=Clohesyomyces aquaticus TaxID=1231657 RepID=A0A1Y1Z068_9PLEO|nr:hypothetical protein BCR34DRAFT_634977 [Clohesyomyces aquaticus]
MENFNSPWSKTLEGLRTTIESVPSAHTAAFEKLSAETLNAINNPAYLHVWEVDGDVDSLLHLEYVIVMLRALTTYVPQKDEPAKYVPAGMVIIVSESEISGRDTFSRVCDTVKHIMQDSGTAQLNGFVKCFSNIAIVRGVNNSKLPTPAPELRYTDKAAAKQASDAVQRITLTIFKILEKGFYTGDRRKIVWHHGPVVHFLLYFVDHTTPPIRNALAGITVHSLFTFTKSSTESPDPCIPITGPLFATSLGQRNTLTHLSTLSTYTTRLHITTTFLTTSALLTPFSLNTYIPYWAHSALVLLPRSVWLPHFHSTLDELVLFSYRLWGGKTGVFGKEVVAIVQAKLREKVAGRWARRCIQQQEYGKEKCKAEVVAGEGEVYRIVNAVDGPIQPFGDGNGEAEAGLPAWSRLSVGPVGMSKSAYIAAPVAIDFGHRAMRVSSTSPFRVLLPRDETPETVRRRIGEAFGGLVSLARGQGGGNGRVGVKREDVECWKEVVGACEWALAGGGRRGKDIEERVGFVRGGLRMGGWASLVGGV